MALFVTVAVVTACLAVIAAGIGRRVYKRRKQTYDIQGVEKRANFVLENQSRWFSTAEITTDAPTSSPTAIAPEQPMSMTTHMSNPMQGEDGACAHYVMVSKFQWKPFWLATQLYQQIDWTGWQNRANYDVFAQAPLLMPETDE